MTWQPRISVFDERGAKDALIKFFKANQAAALLWANDGAALPPIAKFFKQTSVVASAFPSLMFNRTSHNWRTEGDLLIVNFAVEMEIAIIHGKQDYLSDVSPKYQMAIESMLANLPNETFAENSKIDLDCKLIEMETVSDVQGKMKKGGYIQIFTTSAQWEINASLYSN